MQRIKFLRETAFDANKYARERAFWVKQLAGELAKSHFPYDHIHEARKGTKNKTGTLGFKFPVDMAKQLIELSKDSDVRLFMIFVTGLVVLIHKYTGNTDVTVGAPVYKQEFEGEFINTLLALRNRLDIDMTFKECLLQVRQTIINANKYQNYPVELLIKELSIPTAENSGFPLFDMAIIVENIHDIRYLQHIQLNTIFSFKRIGEFLEGRTAYNPLLYKKSTVERVVRYFNNLFYQVLANVDIPIAEIEIIPGEEKQRLLFDFNDTRANYPVEKPIHGMFAEQAARIPNNIALMEHSTGGHPKSLHSPGFITYDELNKKSAQLARILRKKGVKSDGIVPMLVEPSAEAVLGILAILKAGGAYLPIDPDYPKDRIISMMDDANVPILLTGTMAVQKHSFTGLQGLVKTGQFPKVTSIRPPVKDFDVLPIPDRSLVNYEKYNRYIGQAAAKNCIALQATRGCPYKCAYCHKIWPKSQVSRSAENIFAEVLLYYKMGIRRFSFVDDIFNLDIKNSRRFFELVIENGLHESIQLFFPNGIRGDILTREYIDLMVKAGTVNMAFALETASPRLQKLIKKHLNLKKFRENIEYVCEIYPDVIVELFTMHGYPTETEEEAIQTLDFIKSLKWVHFPYVFILRIYHNTDMEKIAIENGISREAIEASQELAYHELPDTLPFDKSFTLKYQSDYANEYFLSRERLRHVLPQQMKILTENEILQKYNSYLPVNIHSLESLLELAGITRDELPLDSSLREDYMWVPGLNKKIKEYFTAREPDTDAMRILLLDLSQTFSQQNDLFSDLVEPPLGLMYLMSYVSHEFGNKVQGRIAKSMVDFDSYAELKDTMDEFKPHVIGIRTLSISKEFFHKTAAMIRHWGIDVPLIAGGPYATSAYETILQDRNVDLVVIGEGEITFCELIKEIMKNSGKLPDGDILKDINGIAFIPRKKSSNTNHQQKGREIVLADALIDTLPGEFAADPAHFNQPTDMAYVIYTSGTTGKPKGSIIEHRNVVRLMVNDKYPFDFNSRDTWTMFHSYCFDFSVWEMYGALLYGGKLVLIPRILARDTNGFLQLLKEEKVTVLNQTPAAFYHLIDEELKSPGKKLKLNYVIFGGDVLKPVKLKKWREKYPGVKLINMFGITETTVHVTFKEIGDREIRLNLSNIGKPIPTLSTYVMDENRQLLPIGVPGELYVGGDGLGRGYLNRPGLTSQRFLENPYKADERIYRSGDLVRLQENGEMEYLGRKDLQVKVRGFRIELGEIESQLLTYGSVKEAVVVATEDKAGDKRIVAYVIPGLLYGQMILQLLRLEKQGALRDKSRYELPNGMPIYYLNRYETDFMYREIFEQHIYLKHGITLNDGACVFDIGANIGLFSLFVSQQCKDARIYAFEPLPPIYEILKINTSLYGTNMKILEYGISNVEEEAIFTFYPHAASLSGRFANKDEELKTTKTFIHNQQLLDRGKSILTDNQVNELLEDRLSAIPFKCGLKTISQVIRENGVEHIDLLKIDVEKSEVDVLNGIEEEDWPKIRQLVIEVHNTDGRLDKILDILRRHFYITAVEQDELLEKTGLYNVYAKSPEPGALTVSQETNHPQRNNSKNWCSPERFVSDMRDYLKKKLPDYMVPSLFFVFDKFPLTSTGKIDRRALPAPEGIGLGNDSTYCAPRNAIEKKLVAIWQEVLGRERIGINDNFFEVGGDSIKSIQISARLRKQEIKVEITDIFLYPTIKELAGYVKTIDRVIDQELVRGKVQLTPIQRWFFQGKFIDSHHFNHAVMFYRGIGFEEAVIKKVFQKIVRHHDALRMIYKVDGDRVVQVNRGIRGKFFHMEILCLEEDDIDCIKSKVEKTANRIQAGMNLSSGALVKLGLFKTRQGDHLLIAAHHLVIDGVSWRILLEDFSTGYEQALKGEEITFPAKTDSFKYWAQKLTRYAGSKAALRELPYWQKLEESAPGKLPRDYEVEKEKLKRKYTERIAIELTAAETLELLKEVNHAYNTEINDILLTALVKAMKNWRGMNNLLIIMEGHGREPIMKDLVISRTMGWFTSAFPVLLDISRARGPADEIKTIKELLRNIPNKGIGYGILRYLTPAKKKTGINFLLQPEISFNYLGQFGQAAGTDQGMQLSGLSKGNSISPEMERFYALEFSAITIGKTFRFTFSYNRYEYKRSSIEDLASCYKKALTGIVHHCLNKKEKEFTPSDFTKKDMDMEELNDVLDMVADISIDA